MTTLSRTAYRRAVPLRGAGVLAAVMLALGGCMRAPGPDTMAGMVVAPTKPVRTTVPFQLDANRILVDLDVVGADGRDHKVVAWLNMGVSGPVLSSRLYRELAVSPQGKLRFRIGDIPIEVEGATVTDGPGRLSGEDDFEHFFGPRPVEAILPAGVLQHFAIVLDYGARRLTLADPALVEPDGDVVPIRLNEKTGLVTADARIGEAAYPVVIDAGAPYTWFRGDVAASWLAAHPDWRRAEGAVGRSNAAMLDFAFEKQGTVMRLPTLGLGATQFQNVGALATAPLLGAIGDRLFGNLFWDTWQKNAPQPVVGWIGGNALADFKVTIDYAGRKLYLARQRDADPHDLDQVGVTLVKRSGDYVVGGIVAKAGVPTVDGVAIGDRIVAVDGVSMHGVGRDVALHALAGRVGTPHRLTVARGAAVVEVETSTSAF